MKQVHVKTFNRVRIPNVDRMYICRRLSSTTIIVVSTRDDSAFTYDVPLYTKVKGYSYAKNY